MSLSFLRPLGLPRPATLTRFLGVARASTTTTTSTPTTAAATPAPSTIAPDTPYRVERTGTNNLPVYQLAKRGGNLKQTRVRRLEGNLKVLREELRDALSLDDKLITINQLTRHIIIKGHKRTEVMKFLLDKGF